MAPVAETPRGPLPATEVDLRPVALRALRALVQLDRPAAVSDLTPQLGGHPNSVRLHVEGLVAGGLARLVPGEAQGRGRPAKLYEATIHGRQLAEQDATLDDFHALIEATADHLGDGPDAPEKARELGRAWGRRIVQRSGSDGGMMRTLAAQGFTPTQDGDVVLLRTCPFLGEARRRPELICSLHQGLVDVTSDDQGVITPFAAPGACVVTMGVPADQPADEED